MEGNTCSYRSYLDAAAFAAPAAFLMIAATAFWLIWGDSEQVVGSEGGTWTRVLPSPRSDLAFKGPSSVVEHMARKIGKLVVSA